MKLPRSIIVFVLFFALGVGLWLFQNGYFHQSPATFEPLYPAVNENGDPILGVFEGRTPCASCKEIHKMKVVLTLYQNKDTEKPTTYWLGRVSVGDGEGNGQRIETEGTWTIRRGLKEYPEAVVYELDSNTPEELRLYWRVNENILLPLDQNMNLKVGNASWGYMLSRTR